MLYREHAGGPVLGYSVDLVAHGALFKPDPTMAELAQIVYVDDLCSPTGHAVRREVAGAGELVEHPGAIKWVYDSQLPTTARSLSGRAGSRAHRCVPPPRLSQIQGTATVPG